MMRVSCATPTLHPSCYLLIGVLPLDAQTTETEPVRIDAREASLPDFGQWTPRDLFDKPRRFRGFLKDWRERGFDRYMLRLLEYRGGKALVASHDGQGTAEVAVFCSACCTAVSHSVAGRETT